jgi:hypothetical protein
MNAYGGCFGAGAWLLTLGPSFLMMVVMPFTVVIRSGGVHSFLAYDFVGWGNTASAYLVQEAPKKQLIPITKITSKFAT